MCTKSNRQISTVVQSRCKHLQTLKHFQTNQLLRKLVSRTFLLCWEGDQAVQNAIPLEMYEYPLQFVLLNTGNWVGVIFKVTNQTFPFAGISFHAMKPRGAVFYLCTFNFPSNIVYILRMYGTKKIHLPLFCLFSIRLKRPLGFLCYL